MHSVLFLSDKYKYVNISFVIYMQVSGVQVTDTAYVYSNKFQQVAFSFLQRILKTQCILPSLVN